MLIKFELSGRLEDFLQERRRRLDCKSFHGPIEDALQERLVPYTLLKGLLDPSVTGTDRPSLEGLLRGSHITFRRPPRQESEITRLARQLGEEREYARMLGRDALGNAARMTEGTEWRELRRTVLVAFNALLSIVGVGAVAYFLARRNLVLSVEASIVCACATAVTLLVIEIAVMALNSHEL